MKAEEFLSMYRHLNYKIDANIRLVSHYREMSTQLSSPQAGDKVLSSQKTDAPFVRPVEKIIDLEREIDSEIDELTAVREYIREAISSISDPKQQTVLQFRYLYNMSWKDIASELFADRTTVYRWHKQALEQIKVPERYADS